MAVTTRRFMRKDGQLSFGEPLRDHEIFRCIGDDCVKYVIPSKKENWILFVVNEHSGIVPIEVDPKSTMGELQNRLGKEIIPVKEYQVQGDPMQQINEICINRDMFKVGTNCFMYRMTKFFRYIGF